MNAIMGFIWGEFRNVLLLKMLKKDCFFNTTLETIVFSFVNFKA